MSDRGQVGVCCVPDSLFRGRQMAKRKIDKAGLVGVLIGIVVVGPLYYFGYTTERGAHILNGFNYMLLFYSFLSPLYYLIRVGIFKFRSRKAARLGLTYEAYEAQRRAGLGLPPLGSQPPLADRWLNRLLRVARWELVTATVLLLVFGAVAEHIRQTPGEHPGVTALGWLYAFALYSLLGLQVLHRVWARWHHRLAPGSMPPVEPAGGKLSRAQVFWNCAFGVALLFALVELGLVGAAELMAVLFAFVAPAIVLLLLAGVWRMLRPLVRHRHAGTAQEAVSGSRPG